MRNGFIALVSSAILMTVGPAVAFDMGPLDSLLKIGQDDKWQTRDQDGFYVLDNDKAEGAVRYYFVNPRDGEEGRRTVSVEIDLRDESWHSRGGILYGFIPNPKSYFIFSLNADKSISLLEISGGNLERRLHSKRDSVTDGVNTLMLEEEGNVVHFSVNGERLSSLGNDRMGQGAVGIVALDPGEYAFRNFKIELADK